MVCLTIGLIRQLMFCKLYYKLSGLMFDQAIIPASSLAIFLSLEGHPDQRRSRTQHLSHHHLIALSNLDSYD